MNILITGVDGYLGGKITKKLIDETSWNVIGLTMSTDFVQNMVKREGITEFNRVSFLTNEEFLKSDSSSLQIDGAVHLAFSRRMQPAADIASSIVFASSIFHKLADCGADRVINMSSQGVYGNTEEIRTEQTPPAPATQYTMAKYAAEVLFNDILKDCLHHTNFRLDPVAQSQNVLKGLCKSGINGKIFLKGGKQVFSFIDANEVPGAALSMLRSEGEWAKVYNVGWNQRRYTLVELAELVADAIERVGRKRPEIELQEENISLWAGMDSTEFTAKTGWKPEIGMEETLDSIVKTFLP